MTNFLKNTLYIFIGIAIGAIGGYLYWNFISCSSGSCAITSVWYNSTAYGAIMGGLLAGTFKPENKKAKQ